MSVVVVTFNHEAYIEQAIESAVVQDAEFDIEIIVGDDHSTDQTVNILRRLQSSHSSKIRLLLASENSGDGGLSNEKRCLASCRGEFVAWLDGDDYWTNRSKLSRQVELLRNNQGAVECVSAGVGVRGGDTIRRFEFSSSTVVLEDLLYGNPIIMSSAMFRADFAKQLDPTNSDWFWHSKAATAGPIMALVEEAAAYRMDSGGAWNGLSLAQQRDVMVEHFSQDLVPFLRGICHDSLSDALDAETIAGHLAALANSIESQTVAGVSAALHALWRTKPASVEPMLDAARLLQHSADYGDLLREHLENSCGAFPGSSDLQGMLGSQLLALGLPTDAIVHFRQALELVEMGTPVHRSLSHSAARALTSTGCHADATEVLSRYLRYSPHDAETNRLLGAGCVHLGDLDEAVVYLRSAVEFSEPGTRLHLVAVQQAARALDHAQRTEEAKEMLYESAKAYPDDAALQGQLGRLLLKTGEYGSAIDHLVVALANTEPGSEPYLRTLRDLGRAQSAAS